MQKAMPTHFKATSVEGEKASNGICDVLLAVGTPAVSQSHYASLSMIEALSKKRTGDRSETFDRDKSDASRDNDGTGHCLLLPAETTREAFHRFKTSRQLIQVAVMMCFLLVTITPERRRHSP